MIKVEEISKSFDGVEILKEISTVFDKGKAQEDASTSLTKHGPHSRPP